MASGISLLLTVMTMQAMIITKYDLAWISSIIQFYLSNVLAVSKWSEAASIDVNNIFYYFKQYYYKCFKYFAVTVQLEPDLRTATSEVEANPESSGSYDIS